MAPVQPGELGQLSEHEQSHSESPPCGLSTSPMLGLPTALPYIGD
jgi:hypothetical protein